MTDEQCAADTAAHVASASAYSARTHLEHGDSDAAEAQLLDALEHVVQAIQALGHLSVTVTITERT